MTPPTPRPNHTTNHPRGAIAPVRVGDPAPDFTLPDQHARPISLSAFRPRPVVLYFYPRNNTPACTTQACTFRDQMQEFAALSAQVLGVSADTVQSHAEFSRRFRLEFPLLSDVDGAIRALYGVPRTLGLFPGRTTYIIDSGGILRHVFSSQLRPRRHIEEARRVLHQLAQG